MSRRGPTFGSALRNAPFRQLLVSHAAGTVAQLVLTLGIGLEVLARTGSGPWVSVTVALGFAPYVLFSGLAGVVADRFSRSLVLCWSAAVRAACTGTAAVAVAWGWPVPVLVALSATAAVAATPAYPALAAATPQLVPDHQLTAANALATGIENVSWIAGPGVFGLLLVVGLDTTDALVGCTLLFVAASATAGGVRLRHRSGRRPSRWYDPLAGVRVLRDEPAARGPMALAMVDNFLYGYLVVALVLLAEGDDGSGTVGRLNAALALGALAGLLVVNRLTDRPRPARMMPVAMLSFTGAVAAVVLTGPTPLGLVLVGLAGGSTLVAEVIAVTMLQRAAPNEVGARLFGVYDQLNVAAVALGSLLAGPLASRSGGGAMVWVAAACLLTTLLLVPRTSPRQPALVG